MGCFWRAAALLTGYEMLVFQKAYRNKNEILDQYLFQ